MARAYGNIIQAANIYIGGITFIGRATTVKLPVPLPKTHEHRPLGLPSTVKRVTGYEPLIVEVVFDTYEPEVLKQFGNINIRAFDYMARWSTQASDGSVLYGSAEFSGTGTDGDRDPFGNGEEPAQTTLTIDCVAFKEIFDGETIYDIDTETGKWEIGGEDNWAPILEGL